MTGRPPTAAEQVVISRAGRTQGCFNLSVVEALRMARLLRASANRKRRDHAKKPFTPEPGKIDMTLAKIERDTEMMERLFDFIQEAGFDIELDDADIPYLVEP